MKEFKYRDVAGFEEINTPRQLDAFEAKGSKSLKTRYIYDFSRLIEYSSGYSTTNFQNLTPNGDNWDLYTGAPGQCEIMKKGIKSGTPVPITYDTLDKSGERYTPYWNEDTMFYLDAGVAGAFGNRDNFNAMKSFRSGYVEITFKTNKTNCILGMGSVKQTDYGFTAGISNTGPKPENTGSRQRPATEVVINSTNAYITDDYVNTDTMYLNLKNGKLELAYQNEFGNTKKSFTIVGDTNLADNEWHHVVINFNKPGTVDNYGNKINKKFIEFWIDGQLEKRDDKYINDNQVFFPMIEWLMMDPFLATNIPGEGWETYDRFDNYDTVGDNAGVEAFIGTNEYNILFNRTFNDLAQSTAFRGSFNHFIAGFNFPLNKYEIQQRYRLFNFFDRPAVELFTATAEMSTPVISVNKKRALKLFWNNLINDRAKNGIELDNNYIVDSYSVTHQVINSKTEVNNIDISSESKLTFLNDVKAVFKDYINLFGPTKQNLYNRSEIWDAQVGEQLQLNMAGYPFDGLNSLGLDMSVEIKSRLSEYSVINMPLSGMTLQDGDRILLTNQFNKRENGIYIFNGNGSPLTRANDALSPSQINNAVVRVIDGYYRNTSWLLSNNISSLSENQNWIELEYHPTTETLKSQPLFGSRWSDSKGNERFIDIEEDLDISLYDLIVFMNYPESNDEIYENTINIQLPQVKRNYQNFIKSLQNVTANGASLYVSSPRLAEDLGIVKHFDYIDQEANDLDGHSAEINPFELNEPAERYFDTHRQNQYHLATEIAGLTDKETYILTDFINYIPANNYDYEQYHAKYAYRQFGLQEGNEFIIPGLSLRQITINENLPGFTQNQKVVKAIPAVSTNNILAGTVVTKFANNHYHNSELVVNEYDDYATTIVVHNGQLLAGQPTNGKIFVNCIEDAYTFSREEYNKATIQVVPENDINESVATLNWQYSTRRLNREPQRINISQLTEYGQTTPTNGGGGPLVQAPTNCSSGIIRSESDFGNTDYQSDIYPKESEERYAIQEIPVLSMTWLGLEWLSE